MIEKKLWQHMAVLFGKPLFREIRNRPTPYVIPTASHDNFAFGICRCLAIIRDHHDISPQVYGAASKRLESELAKIGWKSGQSGYAFPLTSEGSMQRSEFCLAMAKECL